MQNYELPTIKQLKELPLTPGERSILNRQYREPRSYYPWKIVAQNLVMKSYMSRSPNIHMASEAIRLAMGVHYWCCKEQAPVYWLDANLFEALQHTDVPDFVDLPLVVPAGIIMLPSPLRTAEGRSIHYLPFLHISAQELAKNLPRELTAAIKGEQTLCVTGFDGEFDYVRTAHIVEGKGLDRDANEQMQGMTLQNPDTELVHRFTDLVFQILLVMATQQHLVKEAVPKNRRTAQGFGKAYDTFLNPIWIGRNYAHSSNSSANVPQGTHASPQTHWRRGHWRRVAIGPGRRQRKWNWIQPTLVNAA